MKLFFHSYLVLGTWCHLACLLVTLHVQLRSFGDRAHCTPPSPVRKLLKHSQ